MRYREIVNEYILKGNVEPQGITYAYVYKDKYALEVPEIIRTISVNVSNKIIDKIIMILAGNEKYDNRYGSWKPILIPYAEQIKTAILKDAEINLQNVSAEVKEIFLNDFKQQTAEGLLGQIMSETSFAYEGNVPAKHIEVYEVSKTRKADPIGDTEQDYTDVEKAAVAGQRPKSQ